MEGVSGLQAALLGRPEVFLGTFTQNLMAYALGRRVEYTDIPAVRKITRQAVADGYRISSLVLGVINSSAFKMSTRDVTEVVPSARQ